MATVSTVKVVWQGFTGAPGYTRFNFFELADGATVNAAGAAVRTFFDAIKAHFLNTWTFQVDPSVQHHDLATGDLTGESSMTTPPTVVTGTGTPQTYAGGSGYVLNWITGGIWQGRKVRGRTFIVPAIAGVFSTDGTVSSTVITTAQAAGQALIADPTTALAVWAKKFDGANPPQQLAGALFPAVSAFVPDRSAQLRSRRS